MIILGWNRDYTEAWDLDDFARTAEQCRAGQSPHGRWSVGNVKNIAVGSDAFLLIQGSVSPRGLIAHAQVTRAPYAAAHWRLGLPDATCNYVDLAWTEIRDFDEVVPVAILATEVGGLPWLAGIQQSGVKVPEDSQMKLWKLWNQQSADTEISSPYEVSAEFEEGAKKTVTVNRYERDPIARRRCLEHYGNKCFVCELDPVTIYGSSIGPAVINVHHVVPLHAGSGDQRTVDSIRDLRPLCPNCHTAIHRTDPLLTPEEFRAYLRDDV